MHPLSQHSLTEIFPFIKMFKSPLKYFKNEETTLAISTSTQQNQENETEPPPVQMEEFKFEVDNVE
jgi:hypothetical protein